MATIKMKTAVGELMWVSISGEGKEDLQGRPKYQATVVVSKADAKKLQDEVMKHWEDNRPKAVKAPKSTGWYPHKIKTDKIDPDTDKAIYDEDPEGRVEFRLKTNTVWPDGKVVHVATLRPNGNPINLGDKEIGNGSKGALVGSYGIYLVKTPKGAITDAGITMYLTKVQLTKFVAYEGDNGPEEAIETDGDDGLDSIDVDGAEAPISTPDV